MSQWCLQNISVGILNEFKASGGKADMHWTPVREWMLLEQNFLLAQVYFGILFVVIGTLVKTTSFWNTAGLTEEEISKRREKTVYLERSEHQDFLGHMKFEFIQFCFFGSYLMNAIFVLPDFKWLTKLNGNALEESKDGKLSADVGQKFVIGLLIIAHIAQLILVYLAMRGGDALVQLPKCLDKFGLVVLLLVIGGAYGIFIAFYVFLDATDPEINMWLEIELVSIPAFAVYSAMVYFFYKQEVRKNKEYDDHGPNYVSLNGEDVDDKVKALNEQHSKMCRKLILRPSYHTYTILCFAKENKDRYMLSDKKLAKRVYQSQLIYVF